MAKLKETVALVTGASRGAGRGIAVALGKEGATVYITGRSHQGEATENLPGTISETAEEVTQGGGKGIPIRCDHVVDSDVESLIARIEKESGHLDIVVNNVWGGYEQYDSGTFDARFWRQPSSRWDGMFGAGVRAHLITSQLAVPLMLPQEKGLIVCTTFWDDDKYLGNLYYDVAKAAINRIVFGMAKELRPYNIAAVALSPGFMRTERVMASHAKHPFDLSSTESPEYMGRAIVALAQDRDVIEKSGGTLKVGDLAREYGFTDIDGRRIPPFSIPDVEYEKEEGTENKDDNDPLPDTRGRKD